MVIEKMIRDIEILKGENGKLKGEKEKDMNFIKNNE